MVECTVCTTHLKNDCEIDKKLYLLTIQWKQLQSRTELNIEIDKPAV